MDAGAEASSSSPSKLGHRLRTTVCCCFGGGSGAGPERVRWRRRGAAAGEFRYDALSYALNFDEGGGDDDDACAADPAAAFRYRNFNARLPPSPAAAAARTHQRATAIAIA
ncbi:hypothetical protein SEVIR_4G208300v4 [Setaria viridis]|uniref:Uncharacterized protein n=1 Tax=Setaria viridis TaxID=4556 RepID=A0A4U6V2T5_SETVI|nr:uncharacterized protein LOC117851540 [Setaria viridis]TKW22124.1 hypothetical protein SEVIR_4G208300v2 [Setaria viridis]